MFSNANNYMQSDILVLIKFMIDVFVAMYRIRIMGKHLPNPITLFEKKKVLHS